MADETTNEQNETTEETTETNGTGINWGRVFERQEARDDHGAPSREKLLGLIQSEIDTYLTSEIATDKIAEAIKTVYSRMPKAEKVMVTMDVLTNRAVNLLDVPLGEDARVSQRVKDFIRGESKRFEASNGKEGLLWSRRGRASSGSGGGGVRLSNPAVVKEYLDLQARKAAASEK